MNAPSLDKVTMQRLARVSISIGKDWTRNGENLMAQRNKVRTMPQAARVETPTRSGVLTGPKAAPGPLRVSAANPRYFTFGAGDAADRQAVYLTGSHIWNNFHDGMGPGADCDAERERFDYDAYLDFLEDHGHNFIRLWRWEQFKSQ